MWPFRGTTQEDDSNALSTSAEEAPAPTARQARQERRDGTRSTSEDHLQPPVGLRGIRVQRTASPQARIRELAARRSPSPSPTATSTGNNAFFPPEPTAPSTVAMEAADIERITANAVRMALQQDREERDRQSRIATEAAVTAALANQTSQVRALRRPDLPPFDKTDIEAWIRRIENSYTRNGITQAKDKFAFIEKLFTSKEDARVNAFLMDDQTDVNWDAFLQYLRGRHGRTKKQEVYALLNGVNRDGRRPTDLAAIIKERTRRITLDDVRKEVLLKEIPPAVRQHLAAKINTLTFDETAAECDKYFDMSGKVKESNDATSINNVGVSSRPQPQLQQQPQQQPQQQSSVSFTSPFAQEDSDPEVNAVRFRNGQRQQFSVSNRSSSRGRSGNGNNGYRGGYSSNNNNGRSNSNFSRQGNGGATGTSETSKKICKFHHNYGKEALRCEGTWCSFNGTEKAPKGQASR